MVIYDYRRAHNPMLHTLNEFADILTSEIDHLLSAYIDELDDLVFVIGSYMEYFKKLSISDGKRIRGYLVYMASNFYVETDYQKSIVIAAALEIFHTALLIHDDIMDQSDKRRGIESFHVYSKNLVHDEKQAESIAIAIADAAFFLAQELILQEKTISRKAKLTLLKEFNHIALRLGYGQTYDVLNTYQNDELPSFKQILDIYNLKTGEYTFRLPIHMGLSISNTLPPHELDTFAYYAGIVYQLSDDCLDLFSTEQDSGKTMFNDLLQGKTNAVIRFMFDTFDASDKKYLTDVLAHKKDFIQKDFMEKVRRYDIEKLIRKKITEYTDRALDALQKSNIQTDAQHIMQEIIVSLANRRK